MQCRKLLVFGLPVRQAIDNVFVFLGIQLNFDWSSGWPRPLEINGLKEFLVCVFPVASRINPLTFQVQPSGLLLVIFFLVIFLSSDPVFRFLLCPSLSLVYAQVLELCSAFIPIIATRPGTCFPARFLSCSAPGHLTTGDSSWESFGSPLVIMVKVFTLWRRIAVASGYYGYTCPHSSECMVH